MTKDQETPVTETPNSGESGQKTSKPKARASARGKSATATEATPGQAEKTSSRSSPASKTSSSSSPSADTPAPKAIKPKAGKSAAAKSVAAPKSTGTKPESAEEASAVKGASAPKAAEKSATKAKSASKTAAKSKPAAGSKSGAEEKTVKKTAAKTEKKAASSDGSSTSPSTADSKPATVRASAPKSRQTTAKSGAKPAAVTAKSGTQDTSGAKAAPAAKPAPAESAKNTPKAAGETVTAKTPAAKAAPAGNAAPNAGQAPRHAAKAGDKLPATEAAKAAAVSVNAQSSPPSDNAAADGAHKAGAKPASAARSRAATKARAATARKKTTPKSTDTSAEKASGAGKAATAKPKSDATAKTPVRATEKISPASAGATASGQAMPKDQAAFNGQAAGSARQGKDLTPPAAAARTAESTAARTAPARTEIVTERAAGQSAQQPGSAPRPDRAKPAAASAAQAGAAPDTVKTTTAVLALASTERLALTGRDSLAIESTEMLALTVTTSEAVSSGENGASADAASETSGDAPRRKNRRGRRGGRGRNRKKEQNGENGEALTVGTSSGAETHPQDALQADDAQQDDDAQPLVATAQAPAVNGTASDSATARDSAAPTAESKKTASQESGRHKSKSESANARRRMFISVLPGEQVEVALTEDGQLLEYYLDMLHQRKIKGNIYKGVIHNIDTNLQAAFVSYGAGKNGFLQIDEIHPEYWLTHHEPAKGKKFPPIQKVLKAGQEVLVQVVKEPTGSKGAFLTTWLSLAGRFLVLTPGQEQIGVSRKVDDEEERSRLREMMNGIDPGQGLGVIVRTVSAGTTKTTLKNDLQYLKRVWRDIRKKATEVTAPALIYQEPGLSERAVRDYLTEDVGEIWVDHEDVAQSIRETVNLLFPRKSDLVRLHSDVRTSMWERFSLRRQLDQIYTREVLLPSGGRLVFDQTEALMAVDINSGKISGKGNFEAMAHKTNMEAAETIARHLKLRDIGGQVVIDFIEMRDKKHIIEVEKTLRSAMKNDRARHDVGRMSAFGLLELVRQRTGSSALAITMEPCPSCGGTGQRRNLEWQALQALRELRRMLRAESKEKCVYSTSAELALYLLNHKRDSLREMEQDYGKCLEISVRP